MRNFTPSATVALLGALALSCGDSGPGPSPTPTTTTTSAAPTPSFQITTLTTVYRNAAAFAEFTEGMTTDEDVGKILLGVDTLTTGTTVLDNEAKRFDLQQTIDRVNEEFMDADYQEAFGETRQNMRRFLNDADNDGWSVDGRHGEGRDWPHDGDGNDPDGWTAHLVITVTRP